MVLDLKLDYVCQVQRNEEAQEKETVVEEASLSSTPLSSDLTDKLAFMANVALPAVLADLAKESGPSF